ncbi:hypothetical protein H0R92_13340 [Treponema sp. OMZ 840]|uniref:hypothetical protein n=1 Tax=Treponema sp. OMZ 840 TaxID=244313 RepID=UPI003D8F7A0F
MQSVGVCRFCGRTVDGSFIFCPWCGFSRINGERAFPAGGEVFQRLEDLQEKSVSGRISKMEQSLNEIEKDVIRFMEAAEKR